jgi:hypothetical protein
MKSLVALAITGMPKIAVYNYLGEIPPSISSIGHVDPLSTILWT